MFKAAIAALRSLLQRHTHTGVDGSQVLGTGVVTSAMIADGTIVNADVNASAAIAYSKLALSGSIVSADITDGTIVNADINASAAIVYSKLALGSSIVSADIVDGTIVNADINASAAIAMTKLASFVDTTSYTPTLKGDSTAGTHTYNIQQGSYQRIGNQVTATFFIVLTAKGTAGNAMTGNICVSLPLTTQNTSNQRFNAAPGSNDSITLSAGHTQLGLQTLPNTTLAYLVQSGSGAASALLANADIGSAAAIGGTIVYFV